MTAKDTREFSGEVETGSPQKMRPLESGRGVSRRTVVKTGLGALAAPAVLGVIPASAQTRAIKIGHVSPKTGPLAGFGEADSFILDQVRGLLSGGISVGG